jgi:CPA1 family monovalent cation:H+ antiporter
MPTCRHVGEIRAVDPPENPTACPECLREGNRHWVQLRQCLVCGHVGCCDSSALRHASGHFTATSHPVMGTLEPGQDWRWCFVDEILLDR